MSATLSVPQVAELLGISRNSAYEAARTGEIAGVPVIKVGRRLLVPRASLLALLGVQPEDEPPAGQAAS
jgi:excisionase family DNA binding protein